MKYFVLLALIVTGAMVEGRPGWTSSFDNPWASITNMASNRVQSVASDLGEALSNIAQNGIQTASDAAADLREATANGDNFLSSATQVANFAAELGKVATNIATSGAQTATDAATNVGEAASNIATSGINALNNAGITSAVESAVDTGADIIHSVAQTGTDLVNSVPSNLHEVTNGIERVAREGARTMTDLSDAVRTELSGTLNNFFAGW